MELDFLVNLREVSIKSKHKLRMNFTDPEVEDGCKNTIFVACFRFMPPRRFLNWFFTRLCSMCGLLHLLSLSVFARIAVKLYFLLRRRLPMYYKRFLEIWKSFDVDCSVAPSTEYLGWRVPYCWLYWASTWTTEIAYT